MTTMINRSSHSRSAMAVAVALAGASWAAGEKPVAASPEMGFDIPVHADVPGSDVHIPLWKPPVIHTVQEDRMYEPPFEGGGRGFGESLGTFDFAPPINATGLGFGSGDLFDSHPELEFAGGSGGIGRIELFRDGGGVLLDGPAFALNSVAEQPETASGDEWDLGAGATVIPGPAGALVLLGSIGLVGRRRRNA